MNYIEKVIFENGVFVLVLNNGSKIGGVIKLSASSSPDDFTMISCSIGCSESVINSLKKARQEYSEWLIKP